MLWVREIVNQFFFRTPLGKSGGARVITYFKDSEGDIFLLSIYDKGEQDTISDMEILNILNNEVTNK